MVKYFLTILILTFCFILEAQSRRGNLLSDEVLNSILYKTNQEKTTLREVIAELKGNAILIDFWASWCKTCAQEMKYSKELEKTYENQKITFLYLSTDTDNNQWSVGLDRLNNEGKHYRIDEASKKNIKEYFKIKGIPYYVLLDKEGYIYDPKASWPHLEALKNEIDKLLLN